MKAIYLNLDDAVRAVCAGRKVVQSILPLAVTIPAGQTAAVYAQTGTAAKTADAGSAVTAITWTFSPSLGDAIATGVAPGMSQVLASETASVYAVSGDGFTATAAIKSGDTTVGTFSVQVVANRETLDGPVDLVDFTPPAAVTAASINSALGGSGAEEGAPLKGVILGGAKLVYNDESDPYPYPATLCTNGMAGDSVIWDGIVVETEDMHHIGLPG
jgi:hypothetical protein